jgi:hypothetical protein
MRDEFGFLPAGTLLEREFASPAPGAGCSNSCGGSCSGVSCGGSCDCAKCNRLNGSASERVHMVSGEADQLESSWIRESESAASVFEYYRDGLGGRSGMESSGVFLGQEGQWQGMSGLGDDLGAGLVIGVADNLVEPFPVSSSSGGGGPWYSAADITRLITQKSCCVEVWCGELYDFSLDGVISVFPHGLLEDQLFRPCHCWLEVQDCAGKWDRYDVMKNMWEPPLWPQGPVPSGTSDFSKTKPWMQGQPKKLGEHLQKNYRTLQSWRPGPFETSEVFFWHRDCFDCSSKSPEGSVEMPEDCECLTEERISEYKFKDQYPFDFGISRELHLGGSRNSNYFVQAVLNRCNVRTNGDRSRPLALPLCAVGAGPARRGKHSAHLDFGRGPYPPSADPGPDWPGYTRGRGIMNR